MHIHNQYIVMNNCMHTVTSDCSHPLIDRFIMWHGWLASVFVSCEMWHSRQLHAHREHVGIDRPRLPSTARWHACLIELTAGSDGHVGRLIDVHDNRKIDHWLLIDFHLTIITYEKFNIPLRIETKLNENRTQRFAVLFLYTTLFTIKTIIW